VFLISDTFITIRLKERPAVIANLFW